MVYNKINDLVAFSLADRSVIIANSKTGLKKVRVFEKAAKDDITDICFSQPDSKWILVSSLDSCIRVYDILTGFLIDWVKFKNIPISMDFAPSGEYLATSHLGSKAVYLWSNRSFF